MILHKKYLRKTGRPRPLSYVNSKFAFSQRARRAYLQEIIIYDNLSNMITKVIISKSIENKFNKDVKRGLFNPEVSDLIEYWITEIEDLGYSEYKKSELFKMLNDHSLKNGRQGQRSITLDQIGGRLIYTVIKNAIVIKITSDHDYS